MGRKGLLLGVAVVLLALGAYAFWHAELRGYDELAAGSFRGAAEVSGAGASRTLKVMFSVANLGDRDVRVQELGAAEASLLRLIRVQGNRREDVPREPRLTSLPFEIRGGHERTVVITFRFRCADAGRGTTLGIDNVPVGYEVG